MATVGGQFSFEFAIAHNPPAVGSKRLIQHWVSSFRAVHQSQSQRAVSLPIGESFHIP